MAAQKILVADEDTEMLSVLALHLGNEGYDAICASDGQSALTTAQREQPDLILMDVTLDVNERDRLYDQLAEYPDLARIPVIYLIGERTVRLGGVPKVPAKSMIIKPVPTGELFRKIEQSLTDAANRRSARTPGRREKAA